MGSRLLVTHIWRGIPGIAYLIHRLEAPRAIGCPLNVHDCTGRVVRRHARLWVLVLVGSLLAACATPYHLHNRFEERSRGIKTVAFLPPDVTVSRLSLSGATEPVAEWSEVAHRNLAATIPTRFGGDGGIVLMPVDLDRSPEARQEYEDARRSFEAIVKGMLSLKDRVPVKEQAHPQDNGIEGGALVPEHQQQALHATKDQPLDYSLGPLPSLGKATGADALLFVWTTDHVSTAGRRAVLGAIAIVQLPLLRGLAIPWVPMGPTVLAMAIVDPQTGDLLWSDARMKRGYDLRKTESAEALIAEVLNDLGRIAPAWRLPVTDRE